MSTLSAIKPVRFSEIPDGSYFFLAQTYAYGGRRKLQKTMSSDGVHNAIYAEYGGIAITVNANRLVLLTQG